MNIVMNPELFDATVEVRNLMHYLADLMGIGGDYDVDLEVIDNYDYDAAVTPYADGGYEIAVDKEFLETAEEDILLATIAHEMVHIKQYREGRLVEDGGDTFLWNGERYYVGPGVTRATYFGFPWEVEAYGMEKYYLEMYKEYKKGLDILLNAA